MAAPDALVIGAGVSGLTSAICLAEAGLRVTVRTADPPSGTTSAVAGALWLPFLVEPLDRVTGWGRATATELRALASDPATGVRLATGVHAAPSSDQPPPWAETIGAVRCPPTDLPPGFTAGWRFTAPLVEMPVYLGYLSDRLHAAGGRTEHRPVTSLDEALAQAPLVVNCSGIGARELVPDPAVRPVRGQVVVVENPGIEEFFAEAPGTGTELRYVLPHRDTVVLGGTAEPDQPDLTPRPEVARRIVARCTEVVPALAGARVVTHRVGLRPVRPEVRLAAEDRPGGGRETPSGGGPGTRSGTGRVIHNYGHGGGGITLSWGCAREVAALAGAYPGSAELGP